MSLDDSFSDFNTSGWDFSHLIRRDFSSIDAPVLPNLIDILLKSYNQDFLQIDVAENEVQSKGLHQILNSIFPITNESVGMTLEYVKYNLEKPKYSVYECIKRGLSYSTALKVTMRLILWEIDEDTKAEEIKGIKEQEVFLGDIPLMTEYGTFVVNGTERVVVSQMHRSPGVFFDHDRGKGHASGKLLYSARVIPYRGSWLDFEFDIKDLLYFRIDRRKKVLATTILRAVGMSSEDIVDFYYKTQKYIITDKGCIVDFESTSFNRQKLGYDIVDADKGDVVFAAGSRLTPRLVKKHLEAGLKKVLVPHEALVGKFVARGIIGKSGESLLPICAEITSSLLKQILGEGITEISTLFMEVGTDKYICDTLNADKICSTEEALKEIFRVMRPGEPTSVEGGRAFLNSLFFQKDKYDLSEVGRVKMNGKFNLDIPKDHTTLTPEDIKHVVSTLIAVKDGKILVDDIDHLGNRRVRSVGELVENQFRLGFMRIQKAAQERVNGVDLNSAMPYDLINSKLLTTVIKEFFGTSSLSQFMDQTNPLSEVTHKRRLSALGPGGVNRERAGLEVRDVHPTHYGKICPVETPEGQNIGLISSLTTYAKVNNYGFIETPYRKITGGALTNEIHYLSALEEDKYKIGQATIAIGSDKYIKEELVNCRYKGNFIAVTPEEVDYIDLHPKQVVSVAAALIPFLENDDANRALMGSNMQRQAVPLIVSETPLVGTGVENVVAKDSGAAIVADSDGIVEYVDANKIVIRNIGKNTNHQIVRIYKLINFQRSNHSTCLNQKPLVNVGAKVRKGQVIADGTSTDKGELALGKNVLVAFLAWRGYTFEDSIVISEKVVREDVYTSIHIEEFEAIARDTRLGPEEITMDVPNVNEEHRRHLDEMGIVRVGAKVKTGDILVGKVTPKGETVVNAEEKLLRAIFGEKGMDVSDSSLYVPPGVKGTVVSVRIFSRKGIGKDDRSLAIEKEQISAIAKNRDAELIVINDFTLLKVKSLLIGQNFVSGIKGLSQGMKIDEENLVSISLSKLWDVVIDDAKLMSDIAFIKAHYKESLNEIEERFKSDLEQIENGDELPQGALKVVKIFIAVKHKLQPGDKMSGRHGNKGVISIIAPEEDMPFLDDGTVVDVVLNPLGIPSRMNIGQVLETHLGWASVNLGKSIRRMIDEHNHHDLSLTKVKEYIIKIFDGQKNSAFVEFLKNMNDQEILEVASKLQTGIHFSTSVFDGAKVSDVKNMLELAGVNTSGKEMLRDGRTGDYFDRPITVGYKYILKLHHLVDDKVHARSIGPYSLVTQQPLGGKSHFGGQRFGEMECWALQAYGAAYTLQEMLTVKSDDVNGRVRMYESIIKHSNKFEYSIPESFNVTVKELRSLCLDIELENSTENVSGDKKEKE